jgi:hypothetical protein
MGRLPRTGLAVALAAAAAAGPGAVSLAAAQECRVVEFDLTPTADLQIVIWIEDAAGRYVDTAYITRTTGSYGLGNRPGTRDFKSGPRWPYGRRTSTFPVWSHRHGLRWPTIVFQDGADENLSHDLEESSRERTYCRPIMPDEPEWDAVSCASTVWTDKGRFDDSRPSLYPPRADVEYVHGRDDADVDTYADLNPFDAVSRATPLADHAFTAVWSIPPAYPDGHYVAWMEVAREFDPNAFYDFPAADYDMWTAYGLPYRGQPSVVYRVEFDVTDGETQASTTAWVGYGDPSGDDGDVRQPDTTITTDTTGSGARRIQTTSLDGDAFLLRVTSHGVPDLVAPAPASSLELTGVTATTVSGRFVAPGDDELEGTVSGYEVRYLVGGTMDEATWEQAERADVQIPVDPPGARQAFTIAGRQPLTADQIGVRAYDECYNLGPLRVLAAVTPRPDGGDVDACFIATAAYGSVMAAEVTALRAFRDRALRTHVAGELLVEAYYTFGPLAARAIAPSDTLRRAARDLLRPAVSLARRTADRLPFAR